MKCLERKWKSGGVLMLMLQTRCVVKCCKKNNLEAVEKGWCSKTREQNCLTQTLKICLEALQHFATENERAMLKKMQSKAWEQSNETL